MPGDGLHLFLAAEPFTRFATYGLIGLAEACVLFVVSIRVEERIRRRSFAPEWR